MAWDLNGGNQYAQFAMSAALKAATGGPFTFGAVVNLDATTDGALIHFLDGTSGRHFLEIFGTYNWGTAAAAKSGPAGVTGAWYHVVLSKDTGTVTPEYTVTPLATGIPSSGICTGGNLANGAAPGAAGVIQAGRFATSATEYVDGKVESLWCHASYMNQTAREALTTWSACITAAGVSGLGWAVRLDTLSTITDLTLQGGDETGRFGTTPFTLVSGPSGSFFGGSSVSGAATLNAAATLTAAGTATLGAGATLSAAPTLSAAATRVQPAAVVLSAAATLGAAATRVQPAAAVLSAAPTLSAAATRVQPAITALTAAPTLTATGTRAQAAAAVLAAAPTLSATADTGGAAAATLTAAVTLSAAAVRARPAVAVLVAVPVLVAAGQLTVLGGAVLLAAPTLTATAQPSTLYRTAILTAGARSAAVLTPGAGARATLTAGAAPAATLTPSTL